MAKCKKLHNAVTAGDFNAVKTCVQQGIDVNMVYQQETAFTWSLQCKQFNIANLIMSSEKFNPNAGNQFDRTPLFMAAKLNRTEMVRRLIEMGARINDADIRGVTPLGACAWYDSHECAEILIQRGANIDQPDVMGQTPLYRACSNVSKNVVSVLLNNSCDVNLPTCDRKTPLMAALPAINNMYGQKPLTDVISICEILVSNGCDLNAQDENGRTALHHTVESNNVHGMCFISAHGCDLELKDNAGYTALHTAIFPRRPRYEMAKYLLHYGADGASEMLNPNEQDRPTILPICFLMNSRPNRMMNENDEWSRTALLLSFTHILNPSAINSKCCMQMPNNLNHLNLNIHGKIELEMINFIRKRDNPCSLLQCAKLKVRAVMGNCNNIARIEALPLASAMKTYLNLGLSTSFESPDLVSKLHVAIRDRHHDTVKHLLERGASISILLKHRTALALAIEIGNTEATMMIMKSKFCKNVTISKMLLNPSRDTPLHIAAKHGRSDIVREMIALGCDINTKNITGATPLQEAFVGGHFEVAAILIEHRATISTAAQGGVPVLHLAAASGSTEVVDLLLQRGWDVNARDAYGNTPLHVAASKGTEYLLRHVSMPSLYDDEASAFMDRIHTDITLARPTFTKKVSCHLATTEFLLQHGADTHASNDLWKTALMFAEYVQDADIIDAIKRASLNP